MFLGIHSKFTFKVIIQNSRKEVSLVEQDTIVYDSQPIKNPEVLFFLRKIYSFLTFILCNLYSANAKIFSKEKCFFAPENIKKTLTKVAHNRPKFFFSVLLTHPKPAQISNIFHRNPLPCDFIIMTLILFLAQILAFYNKLTNCNSMY